MLKTALAATGIALTFGFNANTLAYDFEIRQQLKYKDYPSEWRTKYKKSGAIKEHDWREKQELQSKTQLFISKQIAAQHFRYQLRLGYKFEEQNDQHIEYKPNGDFKNSKTRHEYQRNSYIGLGFQQRWFQLLGADLISLSGYYDHYYHIAQSHCDLK
ncbi:MAG: hypothetical protein OIF35_06430 [Cellvibrionaceae bacterium]|nr:hypothetical protein [Cellvibrionaceae bacterium]